jgi:IclR family transcriptional regulator, acetate operon repressor
MTKTKQVEMPADANSGSSAQRSLNVLALLAQEGRAMSLADLAQRLNLPKGTAHRLCMQLLEGGYLARDIDERSFGIGPGLRTLALDALNHGTLRGQRHEVLTALVSQVGETCNLTTLDGATVLYLDRVEAPWPWRLSLDVGTHVPMHCTASGKLFLALMPAPQRDAILSQLELTKLTANTLTSLQALRAEFKIIMSHDYAVDREEFIIGLSALAVPVRNAAGQIRATVAVHGPTARLPVEEAIKRLPALQDAARRMAKLL